MTSGLIWLVDSERVSNVVAWTPWFTCAATVHSILLCLGSFQARKQHGYCS